MLKFETRLQAAVNMLEPRDIEKIKKSAKQYCFVSFISTERLCWTYIREIDNAEDYRYMASNNFLILDLDYVRFMRFLYESKDIDMDYETWLQSKEEIL